MCASRKGVSGVKQRSNANLHEKCIRLSQSVSSHEIFLKISQGVCQIRKSRKNWKNQLYLRKRQGKIREKALILGKPGKYNRNWVTLDYPLTYFQNLCNDFLYILIYKHFSIQVCMSYLISLKMAWFPDTFKKYICVIWY